MSRLPLKIIWGSGLWGWSTGDLFSKPRYRQGRGQMYIHVGWRRLVLREAGKHC